MCPHSSGAKLLLSAFNNLAAKRKTEKNQTDRLTDSKDQQIRRALTSEQSNPGTQGHEPADGLPKHRWGSASARSGRAVPRAGESLMTDLLKLQLLDSQEDKKA